MAEKAEKKASKKAINPNPVDPMDREELNLRKRLPRSLPKRKNDIYVNRKTDFKVQIQRCQQLFESGVNEVFIHGLGAAINRAINMALQIQTHSNGILDTSVNTGHVDLLDDPEYYGEGMEESGSYPQNNSNSSVHIRLFKVEPTTPDTPNP